MIYRIVTASPTEKKKSLELLAAHLGFEDVRTMLDTKFQGDHAKMAETSLRLFPPNAPKPSIWFIDLLRRLFGK